jgi:hypothetical protein
MDAKALAFTADDVRLAHFAQRVALHARIEECSIREELLQYVREDDGATRANRAAHLAELQADYDAGQAILSRATLVHGPVGINHEPYEVRGDIHSPEVIYQEGWTAMSIRRRAYALRLRST